MEQIEKPWKIQEISFGNCDLMGKSSVKKSSRNCDFMESSSVNGGLDWEIHSKRRFKARKIIELDGKFTKPCGFGGLCRSPHGNL